jgi:hypothetical protein
MNIAPAILQAGLEATFVLILVFLTILAVLLALIAVLLVVLIARIDRRSPEHTGGVGAQSPGSVAPRTEEVPPATRGQDAPTPPRDVRRETPPDSRPEGPREPPPSGAPPNASPPA